jgi:UDP-glucose 4-epimerase
MARVVLVTGVSRDLGGRFARILQADPDVDRVIGVDVVPPRIDLGRTEFVRADIRNPVIAKVIAQADVDTVVHMNVIATPLSAGGRSSMKEINVIGTMQLLAACQKAPSVEKLVVKSSTTVYGASPRDPAMFTEDMGAKALPSSGYAKDSVEVEGYVRGFARRRPDVLVTMLRFANYIGPRVHTAMTGYLSMPVIPTALGFDPRMQFVHEDDGLEVLRLATVHDYPGTFNIAGDGSILLSQAVRRAGRLGLPVPRQLGTWVGQLVRRSGVADFSPEQMGFLTFGRMVDTTLMRTVLGFEPRFTTAEAFDDFLRAHRRPAPLEADRIVAVEERLAAVVGDVARRARGA